MGVKELWSVLSPYCDRKPLSELRGKTVAIDLAGWVCESLNVVDYFTHPRHYLKNLFFRTSCLILEDVTPVFVLEGSAPSLKKDVMVKRNEIQFRGVQPKTKRNEIDLADTEIDRSNKSCGRQRFNYVLRQCENLLNAMGINCIQAPGEAEAFCAFLNKKKIVDGVISQDSDCFAYGATRVYRNFSISTRGTQAAQGGAIDIYDMEKIQRTLDFGQKKVIALALLCGCDYCPGIDGIGRDGVLKLFQKYGECDILDRLRCWRKDADKYKTLELRVGDKNVCKHCGHTGSTKTHSETGCGVCRSSSGCYDSFWKKQRLLIKTELTLRKKALANPHFPNEEIIQEFLYEPVTFPEIDLTWKQPKIIKFSKQIAPLLQWTKIYSLQKFFPVFSRWHICNDARRQRISQDSYITPLKITKKRTVKGILSIEILWNDQQGLINAIVLEEEKQTQGLDTNSKKYKDLSELLTTVEPLFLVEAAYPALLECFYKHTQNPSSLQLKKGKENPPLGMFKNFSHLVPMTNKAAEVKGRDSHITGKATKTRIATKNLQTIEKFLHPNDGKDAPVKVKDFIQSSDRFQRSKSFLVESSTPITKSLQFDLDIDNENDSINLSSVINDIIERHSKRALSKYTGRILQFEPACEMPGNSSKDDMDFLETENKIT